MSDSPPSPPEPREDGYRRFHEYGRQHPNGMAYLGLAFIGFGFFIVAMDLLDLTDFETHPVATLIFSVPFILVGWWITAGSGDM